MAGVTQFVALGKQHVYGLDRFGSLLVIDAKTGGLVGRLPHNRLLSAGNQNPWSERGPALVNDQNDRIFLVSNTGLVQCLHEIGVTEPIVYRQPASDSETKSGSTDAKSKDLANPKTQQNGSPSSKSNPLDVKAATDATPNSKTPAEPPPADDPFGDSSNPFAD
jgi:hypothetical protein